MPEARPHIVQPPQLLQSGTHPADDCSLPRPRRTLNVPHGYGTCGLARPARATRPARINQRLLPPLPPLAALAFALLDFIPPRILLTPFPLPTLPVAGEGELGG